VEPARPAAPLIDHHQHLFSPAIMELIGSPEVPVLTATDVIELLELAGIRRALVLSTAYMFGSPARSVEDEYAKVRAENDWTASQVEAYPHRLRAFGGFNPLRDYALEELERCADDPRLRHGIKLHFANSDVQLEDASHVERLVTVFEAANEHGMAIVVHMRASLSSQRTYGDAQARAFLERVLPAAPDVTVQVAHLAGTGPGYDDPPSQEVMSVLALAVERGDPSTERLVFDVATVIDPEITDAQADLATRHIRQVSMERVLFGSDAAVGGNLRPREAWAALGRLPLTDAELTRIAGNVAPYLDDMPDGV
jgi:predicted TIM-barrel fold metal-dependent hydrolase